jgi:hypothetical protein
MDVLVDGLGRGVMQADGPGACRLSPATAGWPLLPPAENPRPEDSTLRPGGPTVGTTPTVVTTQKSRLRTTTKSTSLLRTAGKTATTNTRAAPNGIASISMVWGISAVSLKRSRRASTPATDEAPDFD